VPSTQLLTDSTRGDKSWDEVINRGGAAGAPVGADFAHARRLNLKKGCVWVQDPRALHRGTPNTSGAPRPELVICYTRNFWDSTGRRRLDISPSEFRALELSERGQVRKTPSWPRSWANSSRL
jgi:hypothetical protein